MTAGSSGRTVILSPHLDDAVLSLGAWIAERSRKNEEILIITVFAGDPDSTSPSSEWDALCGFHTAGAAARARREEDQRACAIVGAQTKWLPFADTQYGSHDANLVWGSLQDDLSQAAAVLVPGFPLTHPDHLWLADIVTARLQGHDRLGMYVEHPYASSSAGASGTWTRLTSSRHDRASKRRACAAYTSQMHLLRGKVRRMAIAESLRSREWVRWT